MPVVCIEGDVLTRYSLIYPRIRFELSKCHLNRDVMIADHTTCIIICNTSLQAAIQE